MLELLNWDYGGGDELVQEYQNALHAVQLGKNPVFEKVPWLQVVKIHLDKKNIDKILLMLKDFTLSRN
jgi:hypothetical protein